MHHPLVKLIKGFFASYSYSREAEILIKITIMNTLSEVR